MIRYSLIWTLAASLAVSAVSVQAQTPEKSADKAATTSAKSLFDAFQQFSATLTGGIGRDHDRKIYRSGKFMRSDFENKYVITDLDGSSVWSIFSETRITDDEGHTTVKPGGCAKFPLADASTFPFYGLKDFQVVERTMTDKKETVDGHTCKIENVTFLKKATTPITAKMQLCEAEDLNGFPVKIESETMNNGQRYTITYSKVSLDPPDPKLFERPASCAVVSQKVKQGTPKAAPKLTKPATKTPAAAGQKPQQ